MNELKRTILFLDKIKTIKKHKFFIEWLFKESDLSEKSPDSILLTYYKICYYLYPRDKAVKETKNLNLLLSHPYTEDELEKNIFTYSDRYVFYEIPYDSSFLNALKCNDEEEAYYNSLEVDISIDEIYEAASEKEDSESKEKRLVEFFIPYYEKRKAYIEWLAQNREITKSHRHFLLFYYHTCLHLLSKEEAQQEVIKLNKTFTKPYPEEKLPKYVLNYFDDREVPQKATINFLFESLDCDKYEKSYWYKMK